MPKPLLVVCTPEQPSLAYTQNNAWGARNPDRLVYKWLMVQASDAIKLILSIWVYTEATRGVYII